MTNPSVVGVRVKPAGPVHYFSADDCEIEVGDLVVIPAEPEPAVARVVIAPRQILDFPADVPLRPILGKAPARDRAEPQRNRITPSPSGRGPK